MSEELNPAPAVPPQYGAFPSQAPAMADRPGRALGIAGFILSFVAFIDVIGLILSIIGMVKSKRAGQKNGFALAGIIISLAGILFCGTILAILLPSLIQGIQECARLGNGTHIVGNTTYYCRPSSFSSYTSP